MSRVPHGRAQAPLNAQRGGREEKNIVEKKRGRPRKIIDLEEVEELAAEGNTAEDIALALGIGRTSLYKRKDARAAFDKGRALLRVNLHHWQVQAAKSGNVTMLIWLGKQMLGQSDQPIDAGAEEKPRDDNLSASLREMADQIDKARSKKAEEGQKDDK